MCLLAVAHWKLEALAQREAADAAQARARRGARRDDDEWQSIGDRSDESYQSAEEPSRREASRDGSLQSADAAEDSSHFDEMNEMKSNNGEDDDNDDDDDDDDDGELPVEFQSAMPVEFQVRSER